MCQQKVEQQIADFREGRLRKIRDGESATEVDGTAKLVIHLVPINTFGDDYWLEVSIFETTQRKVAKLMEPIWQVGYNRQYNFEGYRTFHEEGYVQLFRNGSMEAVSSSFFDDEKKANSGRSP